MVDANTNTSGSGFDDALGGADDTMAKMNAMRDRLGEAVGRGEGADGLIVAQFNNTDGLAALDLDPRVMRIPSDEFAEHLRTAVNAAFGDYQAKVRQIGNDAFGGTEDDAKDLVKNPQAALAQMEKIGNNFAGRLQGLARELGVQQQRAQDAMGRFRPPEDPA